MTYYHQTVFFLGIYLLLHYQVTHCLVRKWLGLVFLLAGFVLILWLPFMMLFFSTPIISIGTFLIGMGLFVTQDKYRHLETGFHLPRGVSRVPDEVGGGFSRRSGQGGLAESAVRKSRPAYTRSHLSRHRH